MKKIFTKEFIIGLSVIIALLILFFGIDFLKGINLFKPANFYYATYNNVAGLETSAPVMLNGFKVGQVREISYDYEHPGTIKVLFALNKQLRVPEDSRVDIASDFLSGAYVDLVLGSSKSFIPIGEEIKTGISPNILASLTDDLMPKINNILPKVDTLLYNLNCIVADPVIKASLDRLDGITNNVLLASAGLNGMMNRQVPLILNNAGRITYNIDTITGNLAALSSQLKELPLEASMSNIANTTKNLETFTRQLNDTKSTLGLLMNDPELYNKLNRVTADIDSLILDIKKNPKRYISIKLL